MEEYKDIEGEETLIIDELANSENIYPLSSIRIEKGRVSLFELKRRYEERKEIILNPDFQRESVWNGKQKSELIESILMGIPIPIIYLFQTKDSLIQVVDGRQRISACVDFMNNKFRLSPLKVIHDIVGKKFTDLSPLQQRKIEDYQIDTYLIQPPTPERVKFDIFDRVNRGGTRLNNQEMRNALYQGQSTQLINELSQLESFKQATDYSIKPTHMKDRYIILRFIGFYLRYFKKIDIAYKSDIDEFLMEVMNFLNNADSRLINQIKIDFNYSMEFAYSCYGEDIFRFDNPQGVNRRPINMALFESLSYLFVLCAKQNIIPKIRKIKALKKEFDEDGSFTSGVDSEPSVRYRFERVQKFFKEIQYD